MGAARALAPAQAQAGGRTRFVRSAVGEPGCSPLIQMPDGTIRIAPHVVNDGGRCDKALRVGAARGRVDMLETAGRADGRPTAWSPALAVRPSGRAASS